ncbi:MAG: peptidylprolyl isomerase [Pseudomonadota bacterium]
MSFRVAVLSGLALATAGFCYGQTAGESDTLTLEGIAVVVNDEPISYFDVRQRARMLMMTLGAEPTQEVLQQLAGTAREQLIEERLQLQAAKERELEISDEDIARSVEDIAQQAGVDRRTLYEQFVAAGISPLTLEDQIRADIGWRRIMQGLYGSRIRISGNQIEDRIERLKQSYQETVYQLAEIFLFAPDAESRLQAEAASSSIVQQLREGAPFRVAAERFSSAPTASTGGEMGWVSLEDLDTQLADAVRAAPGPGILEPITTEDGIYILALRGKREPSEQTSTVVLNQFVATNGRIETLEAGIDRLDGCDSMERIAERSDGLISVSLGESNLADLSATTQGMIGQMGPGDASDPFEIRDGWSAIVLCEREEGVENLPSRDQIENQLFGRELGMISDRELRDARREATILLR